VAHYLRVPERTIENWSFGYAYPTRQGTRRMTEPLIRVADPAKHLFSFENLIELHVLAALRREHKVEMPKIRKAIRYLQDKFNSPRPLLERDMETDGTDVFVREFESLINASLSGQMAIDVVLRAHLKRIERDFRGVPVRLFPFTRPAENIKPDQLDNVPRFVAIDPLVAYGRPVIVGTRVPTAEVFERFAAGEQPDDIAKDFGRTEEEILEAIRCEAQAA
jgi:uncharacterized protein (DUF433 family)